MTDLERKRITDAADTLVVKVGTRVLTGEGGTLDRSRIASLAGQVARIVAGGKRVVLVSSGAVGAGMARLRLTRRPHDIAQLQAIAALGQTQLIETYEQVFRQSGLHAAQVLLTAGDLENRARYLNVHNTLRALLEYRAVPVINENDTVAVDELQATFGDNDRLAALVTNLLRAPLLVILSHVEGLFDGPPDDPSHRVVAQVSRLDESVWQWVSDGGSELSKGGMASKLAAAQMVTRAGESVIIAGGHVPDVLPRILAGETLGTLIAGQGASIPSRKRWIGFSAPPMGHLTVDAGAARALHQDGRSLLAIGVTAVEGEFEKGDVVAVVGPSGEELARGLCNYSSFDLQRIRGLHSDRIAQVLGHCPYQEVIHRDNLTVLL